MRKSRFSEQQMVMILREADTAPVVEVAKKHGISDQTIYLWRQRYGALQAYEVKRLRVLEQQNARLKKLVAERDLEIEVMKEIAAKNGERARSAATGGLREGAWAVGASGVRAAVGGALGPALRSANAGAGCAGIGGDGELVGAVPAVRLSANPGLPGTAGPGDECRPGMAIVA